MAISPALPIAIGAQFGDVLGNLFGQEPANAAFERNQTKGNRFRSDLVLQLLGLGAPTASRKQQKRFGFKSSVNAPPVAPGSSLNSLSLLGGPVDIGGATDRQLSTIENSGAGRRAQTEQDYTNVANQVLGSSRSRGLGGILTHVQQGLTGVQRNKQLELGNIEDALINQRLGVLQGDTANKLNQQQLAASFLAQLLGQGLA